MGALRAGRIDSDPNAGGGVGLAALELPTSARTFGTASAGKHEFLEERTGSPIDYRDQDWLPVLMDLKRSQVQLIIDPARKRLRASYRAAPHRSHGRVWDVGHFGIRHQGKLKALKAVVAMPDITLLMNRNKGIFGLPGCMWGEGRELDARTHGGVQRVSGPMLLLFLLTNRRRSSYMEAEKIEDSFSSVARDESCLTLSKLQLSTR
jgi:hypothetical protein